MRIIADTFAELVTGQMRETRGPAPGDDPVEHYLTVIAEKTGSLIATSGRYGGMFSGCTAAQVESLRRFGAAIGTAFQISDDIIDITSPSDSSGKTPGTDLREGVHTLPMLYALQGRGLGDRPAARAAVAGPITDDAEVDEALAAPALGSRRRPRPRGAGRARLRRPRRARPPPRLRRSQGPRRPDRVRRRPHRLTPPRASRYKVARESLQTIARASLHELMRESDVSQRAKAG